MPTMHYLPDLEKGQVLRFSIEPAGTGVASVVPAPRVAMEAATADYTTNGWDTVYVVTLPDVNAAIAAKKSSPAAWSATVPGGPFNPAFDATGTFGTWSLTTGGSGSIVRMHIPFTADINASNARIDVQGGVAYIEVKLAYIPQPPASGATPNDLKVRLSGGSADDPVVTVSSVTYTSPAHDSGLDNALTELLTQWMNNNLQQFQHVFATVDVGAGEASGDFAWLAPTTISYAYLDNANIDNALLGILSMTESRSDAGAVQEIGAGAIPSGSRSSFNLSLERVMKKMIMPVLPLEFKHAPAGTFALSPDARQITAKKHFDLDPVKVGLIYYTPTVTSYSLTFVNGQIQTSISVHTPISAGIDAYFQGTYYSTVQLAEKDDGTQSLTWIQSQDPVTNSWYAVAEWVTITEAIVGIILAVAAAIGAGTLEAIEKVVVKILIGLLVGGVVSAILYILTQIPVWIAGDVPDPAPSVSGLIDGATKPQQWADSKEFKIATAVLNGGLQLGGTAFAS